MHRLVPRPLLLAGALLLVASRPAPGADPTRSGLAAPPAPPATLARVPVGRSLTDLSLPVYAHLRGADGAEYALVLAPGERLAVVSGARRLAASVRPDELHVASARRPGVRSRASALAEVLHDDGRHVVVRATAAQAEALAAAGFELVHLGGEPMVVAPAAPRAAFPAVTRDPGVAAAVDAISTTDVSGTIGELSGEQTVTVGGAPVTIRTRHTNSGLPIEQATQLALERFQSWGLAASYHAWTYYGSPRRNVVAELPGTTLASEVVVLCAHLDDMPSGSLAPGADDNASGSAAVLLAARELSVSRFQRTIRFVLFTGEEQGLRGSAAWAAALQAAGTNVVAVLNLDMISWDVAGGPVLRLHTRLTSNPGYAGDAAIATVFQDAAAEYVGTALLPVVTADGETASDHSSFWSRGWPALLAIEDDGDDFNAYYHTTSDRLGTLNLAYATAFTKAAAAAAAHLAGPVPRQTSYWALAPCRVLDTRDAGRPAGFGPPALAAGETRTFAAASTCGIPADAAALVLNATVVGPEAAGHLTLFAGGGQLPETSTVAFSPGTTRASLVVVPAGVSASFSVHNASTSSSHVLVDVTGVFR